MDHSEVKHLPKVDHTPAELDEGSRILLKAAALIEAGGLAKKSLQRGMSFCVVGAATYAAFGEVHALYSDKTQGCPAIRKLHKAFGDRDQMIVWNNAEERTQDEVVAKLRAVALGG